MRKGKSLFIIMISFMILCNIVGVKAAPLDKGNFTISGPNDFKGCYYGVDSSGTQTWTDEQCFKDETLRGIVYTQFKEWIEDDPIGLQNQDPDNKMRFLNTNMREILAQFRGDINAKNKEIKSIKGVQFLTHAGIIDLSGNLIKDFTELNVSIVNNAQYNGEYYGYGVNEDPDNMSEARNVTWKLAGNPFSRLPYGLGGRLVIEAPQTKSSNYPDDEQVTLKFKRDNAETFSGELAINKCDMMDGEYVLDETTMTETFTPKRDASGNFIYRDVNVTTINFVNAITSDETPEVLVDGIKLDTSKGDVGSDGSKKGFTNTTLYFKDLLTSRHQRIGVGADQELHYMTADEFDTITPGSQSFKYYIDPYLYIYDTVEIVPTAKGSVELTKTDKDNGKKLQGAVYSLYQGTTELEKGLTTDAKGVLKISGLDAGNYTLKETQAPTGYTLSNIPVDFKVEVGDVTISGGTSSFTTTGDTPQTYTSKDNHETFIAGALDSDVVLSQEGKGDIESVKVTYRKVDDKVGIVNNIKENYEKIFPTLAQAQEDINTYKKAGHLFGSVKVEVVFKDNDTVKTSVSHTNTLKPAKPPVEPEVPENPSKPDVPGIPPVTPEESKPVTPPSNNPNLSPSTGDMMKVTSLIVVAGVSLCIIGFVVYLKKSKQQEAK